MSPWLLAGLLYSGAGIGLGAYRLIRRAPRVRLARSELLPLALQAVIDRMPPERSVVSDLPPMPGRERYQTVLSTVADGAGIARADVAHVFATTGHRLDIFSALPPHLNDRGYGYWFQAFRPAVPGIVERES